LRGAAIERSAVSERSLLFPACAHKEARNAGFGLVERATSALVVQEARQRELRERLMGLTETRRREILDAAVADADDQLIAAVLSVPCWLIGMTTVCTEY
jgi:DNA-directed RNA polymerase specialized sigma24 family protein